jgi:hypothetical protein
MVLEFLKLLISSSDFVSIHEYKQVVKFPVSMMCMVYIGLLEVKEALPEDIFVILRDKLSEV